MGGMGSGNRIRLGAKRTTEGSLPIDIRTFHGKKLLVPGNRVTSTWSRGGRAFASIAGHVHKDHITLHYTQTDKRSGTKEDIEQCVDLTWTNCNYGGRRPWFKCPACHRRVAVIYHGEKYYACRTCQNLTYSTCNESSLDRMFTRANQIRRRLGSPAGSANSIEGKPKGMHWNTYFRLRDEVWRLEGEGWIVAGKQFGFEF